MTGQKPKLTVKDLLKKKQSTLRSDDGLELIKMILDDNPALKERVLNAVEKSISTAKSDVKKVDDKKPKA